MGQPQDANTISGRQGSIPRIFPITHSHIVHSQFVVRLRCAGSMLICHIEYPECTLVVSEAFVENILGVANIAESVENFSCSDRS